MADHEKCSNAIGNIEFCTKERSSKMLQPYGAVVACLCQRLSFLGLSVILKKFFTKLRSGSGVWGIKEKSKGVGVLQNAPSPDKHMGKLRFVQDWYRKNTVGGIHSARCDFPCNLPLDCSDPLHPGSLPRWKMQLTGRKTTLPGVIFLAICLWIALIHTTLAASQGGKYSRMDGRNTTLPGVISLQSASGLL